MNAKILKNLVWRIYFINKKSIIFVFHKIDIMQNLSHSIARAENNDFIIGLVDSPDARAFFYIYQNRLNGAS